MSDQPRRKDQRQADALALWCDVNGAKINARKTVEMRIDFSKATRDTSSIVLNDSEISIVSHTKLLGVIVSDDLSWSENTSMICQKASQRLHFLVNLKRAGLESNRLVGLYCSFIRSILEYGSCVWHFALTQHERTCIERIQKRALKIIFGHDISSEQCLVEAALDSLEDRRRSRCAKLFSDMQKSSHALHDLLPPIRSTSRSLRSFRIREPPLCHTQRCSNTFVHSCLTSFQ